MKKNKRMTAAIIVVIAVLAAFLPEPTDFIDAGTPLAETIVALSALIWGYKK